VAANRLRALTMFFFSLRGSVVQKASNVSASGTQ
jgi:hypothetical protein